MIVAGSVGGSENHDAIVALFVAGFVLALAALAFLGHSSFELKLESGSVILTKRWFIVRTLAPTHLHHHHPLTCTCLNRDVLSYTRVPISMAASLCLHG